MMQVGEPVQSDRTVSTKPSGRVCRLVEVAGAESLWQKNLVKPARLTERTSKKRQAPLVSEAQAETGVPQATEALRAMLAPQAASVL